MRKNLVIAAVINCLCLCAQHKDKSVFRAGLKLGYLQHTLAGDRTESRSGGNFLAGFWFQLTMNKTWTAQTELLLLDKGIGGGIGGDKGRHWINLHYAELPVLFQYHKKSTYFEFGPGLAYLINCAEHLYGNVSPDLLNNYPFTRSDLLFNAGIGCTFNEKWALGLRLSHSLLPVRRAVPSVSKESYNRSLALSISRRLRKKKATDRED